MYFRKRSPSHDNDPVDFYNKEKVAVLLIDMQLTFLDKLKPADVDRITKNQIKILQTCAEEDIPVFDINWNDKGSTIDCLKNVIEKIPRTFKANKYRNSALSTHTVREPLLELDVEHLIITGINSSYCIKETAQSALHHDYTAIIAADSISDNALHQHQESEDWFINNCLFFKEVGSIIKVLKSAK